MASPGKVRLGFSRASRIKQGRDFARIKQQGQRLAHGCLVANWQVMERAGQTRLGVITSSKVGSAVVRARARRLLRESFRLHQHEFSQPIDLVVIARPSIIGKTYHAVEKDFLTTLRKAGLLRDNQGLQG